MSLLGVYERATFPRRDYVGIDVNERTRVSARAVPGQFVQPLTSADSVAQHVRHDLVEQLPPSRHDAETDGPPNWHHSLAAMAR